MDETVCPLCGGPGVPLGNLGNLEHFSCRNCGMQFSRRDNPALLTIGNPSGHKAGGLARPCSSTDIFLSGDGLQCGNCLGMLTPLRARCIGHASDGPCRSRPELGSTLCAAHDIMRRGNPREYEQVPWRMAREIVEQAWARWDQGYAPHAVFAIYRPSTPEVDGAVAVINETESPPAGWTYLDPARLPYNLTKDQMAKRLHALLGRAPILSQRTGNPRIRATAFSCPAEGCSLQGVSIGVPGFCEECGQTLVNDDTGRIPTDSDLRSRNPSLGTDWRAAAERKGWEIHDDRGYGPISYPGVPCHFCGKPAFEDDVPEGIEADTIIWDLVTHGGDGPSAHQTCLQAQFTAPYRKNPSLLVLGNPAAPARIKKSWEKFHQRPFAGDVKEFPDIPGAPEDLVELGSFVDMKTSRGTWTGDSDDMLCYEPSDKSLWVIGPKHLNSRPFDGAEVRTIAYRTYGKSGKDHAVFEHKFHSPHPTLATVHALAALLDGGKYTVTDWIRK